ncbi:MAG: transporter substrate-binding domain-containing protein [Phyllobacteriaceae bacterium]|nr:transporter substrate-binding domain-containing protein [Phyllobacteriaceae bacterium]
MSGNLAKLVVWLLMLAVVRCALAQDAPQSLNPSSQPAPTGEALVVATRVLPPFMIREGDGFTGFSAQLWQELAVRTGVNFTWKETANVKEILAAVQAGQAQVGIAAISITSEREQNFDFSQPMFESGLQVMVPTEVDDTFSPLTVLRYFSSGAMPYLLGILALLILIPGHIVWWAERHHKDSPFSHHYIPGIFHAMGWALSAAAGQQNDSPRSRLGRITSIAAVFVSLLFLTYWQAELTSSFTVQQLQGGIQGPDDLPGKRVGTTAGSTSATWAKEHQARLTEYQTIAQAFEALEQKQLDAIVFDSPVLLYHAASAGRGKVRVVGPVFRKENYGILFPRGSDAPRKINLRKRVNEALLKMREDGTYDRLYQQWFVAAE